MARTAAYPDIDDELEAHVEDLTSNFIADGFLAKEARQRAQQAFGNINAIRSELVALRAPVTRMASIVVAVFLSLGAVLWLAVWQAPTRFSSLEPIALLWLFLAVTGIVLVLQHWLIHSLGVRRLRILAPAFALPMLFNLSLTAIMDVDRLLVPLQTLGIGLAAIVMLRLAWRRLSFTIRRAVIFLFGFLAAWSALVLAPPFPFLHFAGCRYLTRDAVPLAGALASCQQLSWFDWRIVVLAIAGITGLAALIAAAKSTWPGKGLQQLQKIALTVVCVLLPIFPLFVHDVNNYGRVDVVRWKPLIVQSYRDILGRDPQAKDLEFYALTRSYLNLERIRSVLYASTERRLKIDLLYRDAFGRPATEQEIDRYVNNRMGVEDITRELTATR